MLSKRDPGRRANSTTKRETAPTGANAAKRFIASTELPIKAPSLGGVETLLTQPALTSHAGMSREDRTRLGITDGLVRMSVGLEATEELIEDLGQALTK